MGMFDNIPTLSESFAMQDRKCLADCFSLLEELSRVNPAIRERYENLLRVNGYSKCENNFSHFYSNTQSLFQSLNKK